MTLTCYRSVIFRLGVPSLLWFLEFLFPFLLDLADDIRTLGGAIALGGIAELDLAEDARVPSGLGGLWDPEEPSRLKGFSNV